MSAKFHPVEASRAGAFARVTFAYAVATGASIAAVFALADALGTNGDPWWRLAVAHGVGATVIFAFSRAWNNSSVFDPWWSVAPPLTFAWAAFEAEHLGLRAATVGALVTFWGVRLTYNWARGWPGMHHEDWRYVNLRRGSGRAYWLVSYAGIHMFPAALVAFGCVALWQSTVGGGPLSWVDILGTLVTGGAIAMETVADRQLHDFRESKPPPEAILDTGLWRFSRHPNYFGELSLWWGLWLFAGAATGQWVSLALAGPISMTLLFVFISVPLIERRAVARRPDYADRIRTTSMLIPWPPRRARDP